MQRGRLVARGVTQVPPGPTYCTFLGARRSSLFCTGEFTEETSTTMASWTSGWTWGGGYDDEQEAEEGEIEQSRVR